MSKIVINDNNYHQFVDPIVDGDRRARGLIPRNYSVYPHGSLPTAKPFDLPLIDRHEMADRANEILKNGTSLVDIRNIGNNGKPIPSRDQNGKGFCVPPGTLVRMADGSQKAIEKIEEDDEVISGEGNIRLVGQLHRKYFNGELVCIKAYGHSHLRTTAEHPIFTKRGYIKAGDLTINDWICVPRYAPQTKEKIQTSDYANTNRGRNYVPETIQLNYNSGIIFGTFLAEGSTDGHKIAWSFGYNETDTLVSKLKILLKEEWNISSEIYCKPEVGVTVLVVHSVVLSEIFTVLCGKLASGKTLHADLMRGPKEFLKGLFFGWMAGDGCYKGLRDKAYMCGATISEKLAMNMYDIANFIGFTPSINREKAQVNKYANIRQPVWKVQINPEPSQYRPNYRLSDEGQYIWRKIRAISTEAYQGTVYDIGVEIDHSYLAQSIVVHNCWAHSSTAACLILRAVNNEPYADLSAYAVACMIKNFRDEGGWGAESLEFIADKGIPTSATWPQQSMNRSNDNSNTWAEAAKYKVTEWMDFDPADMIDEYLTALLCNIPVVVDYNWWGHSVCALRVTRIIWNANYSRLMEIEGDIWNSWGDSWSENGIGTISGRKFIPDGAIAPRVVEASI